MVFPYFCIQYIVPDHNFSVAWNLVPWNRIWHQKIRTRMYVPDIWINKYHIQLFFKVAAWHTMKARKCYLSGISSMDATSTV